MLAVLRKVILGGSADLQPSHSHSESVIYVDYSSFLPPAQKLKCTSQEWAVRVGAPFNPYRVFQGVFAPYWIFEHRGISTGAKLCYIRLLGFAGKDASCYPSLETLGTSLGVSERQARDYVKELERAGLLAVEQRGCARRTSTCFSGQRSWNS